MRHLYIITSIAVLLLAGCGGKSGKAGLPFDEDKEAKQSLQGVWIDDEDGDVVFRMEGDTVYFTDASVVPLRFCVVGDSLVLCGADTVRYAVRKLTPSLFVFVNRNGETVKLVKNDDPNYLRMFQRDSVVTMNQQQLVKRDTVVYHNSDKYHCYVQVNPTSYKVFKSSYNDDGVEVDNAYYDNILHVSIYKGAAKIYSSNVVKNDFADYVPAEFLNRSILGDMLFSSIDDEGVHYLAYLGIPNASSNFIVEFIITLDGQVVKRVMGGGKLNG